MASTPTFKDQLITYLRHKLTAEGAEKVMKTMKPSLMEQFAKHVRAGGGRIEIKTDDWTGHVTYVAPGVNTDIDVDQLRENVSDEVWEQITVPTVDPKKLAAVVELGKVSKATVEACTIETPRAGSLRYTGHPVESPLEVDESPQEPRVVVRSTRPRRAGVRA